MPKREALPGERLGDGARERRLDQRRVGHEHGQGQDEEGEGESCPTPSAERRETWVSAFAADGRVAASAEDPALRPEENDRYEEQRHGGGGGEAGLGRVLEQAPDLGGDDVKVGRQRENRGR